MFTFCSPWPTSSARRSSCVHPFFALLALVGLALVYPTPEGYRAAAWFVFGLSALWAVLFAIEDVTAPRYGRPPTEAPIGANPFAPPPPPGKASPPARQGD